MDSYHRRRSRPESYLEPGSVFHKCFQPPAEGVNSVGPDGDICLLSDGIEQNPQMVSDSCVFAIQTFY